MKKIISGILAAVLVFSLAACNNNAGGDVDNTSTRDVTLYFANNEYIMTGDEALEKLAAEERTVEAAEDNLGVVIFEELKKGTENPALTTVIGENIKIHSLAITDGLATVDFNSQDLSGGSMEEEFVIAQIVNSLLSLDEVAAVKFLIDGDEAETLMGHSELLPSFDTMMG